MLQSPHQQEDPRCAPSSLDMPDSGVVGWVYLYSLVTCVMLSCLYMQLHVCVEHVKLCVHVPVEGQGQLWVSLLMYHLPFSFFESGSLTELKLPRLAAQQVPGACLFLLS